MIRLVPFRCGSVAFGSFDPGSFRVGSGSVLFVPFRLGSFHSVSIRFVQCRVDSVRFDVVRFGSFRSIPVRFSPVRAIPLRFGCVRLGSVPFVPSQCGLIRFGSVRFGSVRFGSVRFGSIRFGSGRFRFRFRSGRVGRFGSVRYGSGRFDSILLGSVSFHFRFFFFRRFLFVCCASFVAGGCRRSVHVKRLNKRHTPTEAIVVGW